MTTIPSEQRTMSFHELLQTQRWDDHRFYHHCRINQTLHLISAISFLTAYVWLFIDPVVSAFLGWGVSMLTRQSGHFFFEPKGFDQENGVSHEHKEAIKVGYNLVRKYVLMSVWALSTLVPWATPTLFGLYPAYDGWHSYAHHVAVLWITVGVVAVLLRTLWLCVAVAPRQGIAWMTKILTDPFHDIRIYWRSPLHLLRGQRYDPMTDWPEPMRRL
jgi:hypothetical protein